ncbi:hypothetical protein GCM10010279_28240 [Streptomyces mutabilis]|nr:hypothetical protein GCM10010279_28240 [Streptomyces mutabilis]
MRLLQASAYLDGRTAVADTDLSVLTHVLWELDELHGHATDLLADAFWAAYKARPRLRPRAEMDPSRLVNHQIITSLTDSPEFAGLHRETAGDPYAAAMEDSTGAQEQAEPARRSLRGAEDAAATVADALRQAAHETHEDDTGPAPTSDAVRRAAEAAEHAEDVAHEDARSAAQALGVAQAARGARNETALMRA